jgi:hypothetical protein
MLFVGMDDGSVLDRNDHHSQQTQQTQPPGRHAYHPAVRAVREGSDELNSEKYPSEIAS